MVVLRQSLDSMISNRSRYLSISKKLFVFEALIDMLSFLSIYLSEWDKDSLYFWHFLKVMYIQYNRFRVLWIRLRKLKYVIRIEKHLAI